MFGVAHWIRSSDLPFRSSDLESLRTLAPLTAVALENARIRSEIQSQADLDSMAGIWNRRKLDQLMIEETRRAVRYHRSLSALIIDVDQFKLFNDDYGHPSGDALLKALSEGLRAGIRSVDHVGRFGGEEFLILLPETGRVDATMLAERIRRSVETTVAIYRDGIRLTCTISIGVASIPEDALGAGALIEAADVALYKAKNMGRNRVVT